MFLLYRWPAGTPWASAAPAQLQTLPKHCALEWVYVSIPLGFDSGRGFDEAATACAVYNVSVETAEQRTSLWTLMLQTVNYFNQAVGTTPLLCRVDCTRKPCSALMWLPLEDAIPQVPGRDVELQDLVDAGRHTLLRALESMVEMMAPQLNSCSAKRRRKADAAQVAVALQAAEAVALRRQRLADARRRIIIAGGDAEWILRQLNYVEKLAELSASEMADVYDLAMGEIERVILKTPRPDPIIPDEYSEIAVRLLEVLSRFDPDKARSFRRVFFGVGIGSDDPRVCLADVRDAEHARLAQGEQDDDSGVTGGAYLKDELRISRGLPTVKPSSAPWLLGEDRSRV